MQRIRTVITALTTAHFAIGVWVATSVPGPLLGADDLAYLSMGRTLAAKGAAPLAAQPPYGFLYPILLAPGWLLGLHETSMLRWARVLNALLAALLLPALYVLVRRIMDVDRPTALLAAVVGSVLPASFLTASIVWTENLIPLLLVMALLALIRLREHPNVSSGLVVLALSLSLYATHPRLAPVSVVMIISLAVFVRAEISLAGTLALPAVGAVTLVGVEILRRLIQSAAFDSSGTYFVDDLASRRGFTKIPEMTVHAMGVSAYLVLASAGIAMIGVVTLWRAGPIGRVADIALGSIVGISGWFLTGVPRSDAFLHGRYIEVIAPVVVAAGVVGARKLSLGGVMVWIVPGVVMAGIVGAWAGPGNNWGRPRSPVMMFGVEVSGAPFGSRTFEPGAAASVAVVVGVLSLIALRRAGPAVAGTLLVAFVGLGVWSGLDGLESLHRGSEAAAVEAELHQVDIDRLFIELDRVSLSVSGPAAWIVGLDSTTTSLDAGVTHVLFPSDLPAPDNAVMVADFGTSAIWRLG